MKRIVYYREVERFFEDTFEANYLNPSRMDGDSFFPSNIIPFPAVRKYS